VNPKEKPIIPPSMASFFQTSKSKPTHKPATGSQSAAPRRASSRTQPAATPATPARASGRTPSGELLFDSLASEDDGN